MDLIELVNKMDDSALLLSLDSKKAFDHLSWPFMFETVKAFGVSGSFLTALAGLYSRPLATIRLPPCFFSTNSHSKWY